MDTDVDTWLQSLSDKTPTPGGGAVAALSAAIAAAQLGMVAIYTTGPKFSDLEVEMKKLSDELATLRAEALKLVEADAAAFKTIGAAYSLPKETDEQKKHRQAAIQTALITAAKPPCDVAKLCVRLIEIAATLEKSGNKNVISDVAVGASMTRAALESAIVNIEINKTGLYDEVAKQELQTQVDQAQQNIKLANEIVQNVRKNFA